MQVLDFKTGDLLMEYGPYHYPSTNDPTFVKHVGVFSSEYNQNQWRFSRCKSEIENFNENKAKVLQTISKLKIKISKLF